MWPHWLLGGQSLLMLKTIGRYLFLKQLILFKMKTAKMSLATMQGKMSRVEMKSIMAGSGVIIASGGQCCWADTNTCSKCVGGGWSCTQGVWRSC